MVITTVTSLKLIMIIIKRLVKTYLFSLWHVLMKITKVSKDVFIVINIIYTNVFIYVIIIRPTAEKIAVIL